ncbi:MAG: histidine kinase, partial [Bacteroidota bacterium]
PASVDTPRRAGFSLPPMRASRAYWICQLSGWGLYAVINLLLGALYTGLTPEGFVFSFGASAVGLGATHALRAVVLRRDWLSLPVPGLAARMAGGSTVTAALMAAVAVLLYVAMRSSDPDAPGLAVSYLGAAFNWTALLFIWSGLYAGVHLVQRWRETERQRTRAEAERWRLEAVAREAELRALQAQVNPHFLFNSLNTVRALIAEDPDRARGAVTELSDLLRYALSAGQRQTVPLGDELATVRRYLALEGLRYEERLQAEVRADPDALAAPVPPMVIQTLVENGIKHGISAMTEGGALRVEARTEAGGVRVIVESPGVLDADAEPESGVGLANAAERLRRLCGDRAALVVRQSDARTVRAEVLVPLTPVPTDA